MKLTFTNSDVKIKLITLLAFVVLLVVFNNAIAQTSATEDFENETAANTGAVFSESGINFTTTFPLLNYPLAFPGGSYGYGASAKFLEIRRVGSTQATAITTATISLNTALNPGIGFKINSFAAYTAANNGGTLPNDGIVTIKGTPVGGGAEVSANIAVNSVSAAMPPREPNGMVNGLNLNGTPLDGLFFTSLTFSIDDFNINTLEGTSYLIIDHINFTTQAPVTNNYAIGPVSITEGNSGTSVLSYQVSRSIGTATGSVQIQTDGGTATVGTDYAAFSPTTVNFPVGSTSQTVNLTIIGDTGIEPNETINMRLSNPSGGTISAATATITINDDDETTEIFDDEINNASVFTQNGNNFSTTGKLKVHVGGNFGAGGSSGYAFSTEPYATGNQGTFTITSPGKSFYATSVALWSGVVTGTGPNWTFTPTNCDVTFTGVKFDGSGNVTHTASITPTGSSGHFTVSFTGAGNPFLNVNLSSISFSVPSPINYIQIDNFKYGVTGNTAVQVSIDDVSVLESTTAGLPNTAIFTVSRTNNSTSFSVDVNSSAGSATEGTDYTAFPSTILNFTAGGPLSQTVSVPILTDNAIESAETFNLNLFNATGGTLYLKQVGIGTIQDDDRICETFTNEIANATTFSEFSFNFSATNRYKITVNGGSSINSPGYLIAGSDVVGSMGKIVLNNPGKAFKLSSLDVWASSNGTTAAAGNVTFIGTLAGGGTVTATKAIASNTSNGWNQNVTFTGTDLDNKQLTELEVVSLSPITVVDIDNFCYAIFNTMPIIEVVNSSNVNIPNGGAASLTNNTDFSSACVTGGLVSKTYTLKNTGAVNLLLPAPPNSLILGGADASQFSISTYPSSTLAPMASQTFTVVFNPTSGGIKNATLSITSNDATNSPFVINIKGEGIADPVFTTTTNNGLKFDGVNDFVATNYCSAQPIITGGSAITVEYWFKGSNIQSAVRTQDTDNDYMVAGWSFPPKHILSNDLGTGGGVAVGAGATDGSWHHVAFTWQQNTTNGFKSYLDGQLVQERTAGNNPLPNINHPLYLGAFQGVSEFMNGTLDNVRIWNVARNQAQIQAGMCNLSLPQTGLIVFYSFDHGTANGSNVGINLLENKASPSNYIGVLNNFGLTGTSSNWVQGVIPNTLANGTVTHIQNVSTNPNFTDISCNALGKVEPAGASPVAGNVTLKSWVENNGSFPLVRRHYEINPANNASTATANITLYFTQADFNNYNAILGTSDPKLPINPDDTQGIANIRIAKIAGVSNPSDGLPNSYAGSPVDISGSIISKIWNGQFWEIKFATTGFSGFFVQSGTSNPLPINLISFSGKNTEIGNELTWKTSQEKYFSHFEIERSPLAHGGGISNGKFEKIGQLAGSSSEAYEYLDSTPPSGAGGLYRLKMIDLDGSFAFSKIISIENNLEKAIIGNLYPNPAVNKAFVDITALEKGNWTITTFDFTGKLINTETQFLQKGINKISIEKLNQGINFILFQNNEINITRKVIFEK